MISKKTKKADLENKRSLFFEIGLALALTLVILAFEWQTPAGISKELMTNLSEGTSTIELPPITKDPDDMKRPEPPKVVISDAIKIIDNTETPNFSTDIFDEPTTPPVYNPMPIEEDTEPDPFISVEEMPTFRGGDPTHFRNTYVIPNIKYPQEAIDNGTTGLAIVEFVIERDGSVSKVRVINKTDECFVREAIRVISSSPKWEPGRNNGQTARVKLTIPIKFALQQ